VRGHDRFRHRGTGNREVVMADRKSHLQARKSLGANEEASVDGLAIIPVLVICAGSSSGYQSRPFPSSNT
jgi:hypothetical protein